ncbi:phosphatase PAP2 family protein [bacterium]|nr:phosphatase PAP2 family protein [bacterium]MBU1993899.1 phosphatase PAP2 family protein [bacterium]
MNKKILNVPYSIWALFILFSLTFIFFPQIDLFVADLFYDNDSFPANKTILEQVLYHSVRPLVIVLSLISILIYVYNKIKKTNILNINGRVILFIFLVLSLAPGLIVNVILKDNWGRPRPNQIIEHGGDMHFAPAFIPSGQNGYSFSSGHSAAAFSLIGFALLAKRRKRLWITLALTYGALVSIARMAAGGHFLSDTVTSFFIVYITTFMLYDLLIEKKSPE